MESNLISVRKSTFVIFCMMRADLLPVVHTSCSVPAGTVSNASVPFNEISPSPTGFTNVQRDEFNVLPWKSSETGAAARAVVAEASNPAAIVAVAQHPIIPGR
jgi:hypothetical protein